MTEGEPASCRVVALQCPFVKRKVECAGGAFLRYYNIKCHGEDVSLLAAKSKDKAEEIVFEDDVEYLRSLDPKEWKKQDHYAVLGIKKLRIEATDDDIKRAYRQKVLKHHPDKRKALGEEVRSDDDYFTCITKAYEILGTPKTRRSYDSVDPEFDDSIPTSSEIKKDGFFKSFAKYFEMNARWSEKKNVPLLGDEKSPREFVEKFYSFWYEFDSWREFSYLDEEEKEKGSDRDERRWIEKQNKVARAKLKKEEMARIRTLVDLAYTNDPRIQRFKQEDKDKKLAAKHARQVAKEIAIVEAWVRGAPLMAEGNEVEYFSLERWEYWWHWELRELSRARLRARRQYSRSRRRKNRNIEEEGRLYEDYKAASRALQNAIQAKKAEEERIMKEAQLAKQKADDEEKARLEIARAEREIQKKNLRKERKSFRDLCKSNNYYADNDDEAVAHMASVEKICEMLKVVELQDLIKDLESSGRDAFVKAVNESEEKLEAERRALFETRKVEEQKAKKNAALKVPLDWSPETTQLLIKAVNLFPAGTNQRWDVVANFLNQHGTFTDDRRFNAKEVLNKAKDLQSADFSKSSLKKAANEEAFDQFEKDKKKVVNVVDDSSISKNDTPKLVNGTAKAKVNGEVKEKEVKEERAWTKTEQELLEQAIKTFPVSTTERWEKIADCIPNRSKKDCMKRYKELVELVKAKKQAANIAK